MDSESATETLAHQPHLVSSLSSLFLSEELSDVRLSVNGGPPLPAHRFVLALGSTVFRAMLWGGRWSDGSPGGLVRLTEDDEGAAAAFRDFLRYLYTGSLALGVGNAFAVHALAEKYDVEPLRRACQHYLLENVAQAGARGLALQWRRRARFSGQAELERACEAFVARNLEAVAGTEAWLEMGEDELCTLLSRSDLVVESEYALCQAALRWVDGRPGRRAEPMLRLLRFAMMAPEEVARLREEGSVPRPLLDSLLAGSLGLHRDSPLGKEAVARLHGAEGSPLRQRLYTACSCGSPWRLDFFSAMTKTVLCKEFTTSSFRVQSKWFVTFHPKGERLVVQEERPVRGSVRLPAPPGSKRRCCCPGLYERVLKDNDRAALHCKIIRCHSSSRAAHEHQVTVLFYRFLAGRWVVGDAKTYNVPHWQDVKIEDLLPVTERGKYVSQADDAMALHLIGHTNWRKI